MDALAAYLRKCDYDEEPSSELMGHLPSSYHATMMFGESLLKIKYPYLQELFCIRTYALHHSISHAIHLIREHIVDSTDTFPSRLFEMTEVLGKANASSLEIIRLEWELSDQIPEYDDPVFRSSVKHIRSRCVVKYAEIATDIIKVNKDPSVYEYLKDELVTMLNQCNLANVRHKMEYYNKKYQILTDAIKECSNDRLNALSTY